MRRVVLMMSVSLDGFMEGPNRELDWHQVDDELHGHFNEVLGPMGAFLSGRVTYDLDGRILADGRPRKSSRRSPGATSRSGEQTSPRPSCGTA